MAVTNSGEAIEVHLTVEEQRKLVEAEKGEKCFRMWLTQGEWWTALSLAVEDWTTYPLEDGRYAMWRRESDLANAHDSIKAEINSRRLDDAVV